MLFVVSALQGQTPWVNVGLYPTAVPDSFEIQVQASSPITGSQVALNATFTIRWPSNVGGDMELGSIGSDCISYPLFDAGDGVITDPVENPGYKYFTLLIFTGSALDPLCPITTTLQPLGGFRMSGFTDMTIVNIVNDTYTAANSKNYFLSLDGNDLTGAIISPPVPAGILSYVASPGIGNDYPLRLSSNPASESVHIGWALPSAFREKGEAQLSVVSSTGALVREVGIKLSDNGYVLDVSALAPGLYHLHLVQEGVWITGGKVVVE